MKKLKNQMHPFGEFFIKEINSLTSRSGNMLGRNGFFYLRPFVIYFCIENKDFDFGKTLNCGPKTSNEIKKFILRIQYEYNKTFRTHGEAYQALFGDPLPGSFKQADEQWNNLLLHQLSG